MYSLPKSHQPKLSIIREQHLNDDMVIRKPRKSEAGELWDEFNNFMALDEIWITRHIKKRGTICNGNHDYHITDQTGKFLFKAVEESSCMCVHCCGPARSYAVLVQDKFSQPIIEFTRPYRCGDICWCCCECALMRIEVKRIGNEQKLGEVQQKWSLWREAFEVRSLETDEVLEIIGPNITCRCFTDMNFKVISSTSKELVAQIWKKYKEQTDISVNQDHENFGITFERQTSATTRILLLSACFLLNHAFFEMS